MRILPLIVLLGCVSWGTDARAQEDAPTRGGLLKRGLFAKNKQTTTTTTATPQEEEYVDEAEYQEGDPQASSEAPPTSTEGKKLVAGGVRPFRSNTDLLEALKRRRAQAAEAKLHHSGAAVAPIANTAQDSAATEAPVKASYMKSRTSSVKAKPSEQSSVINQNYSKKNSVKTQNRQQLGYAREDTEGSSCVLELAYISNLKQVNTSSKRGKARVRQEKQTSPADNVRQIDINVKSSNKKRFNSAPARESNDETAAPAKPARARFGRPGAKAVPEPEPVEQQEPAAAAAPARTGRTFRRGN